MAHNGGFVRPEGGWDQGAVCVCGCRRGGLEPQNSFLGNEASCWGSECRRVGLPDATPQVLSDKTGVDGQYQSVCVSLCIGTLCWSLTGRSAVGMCSLRPAYAADAAMELVQDKIIFL